MMRNVFYFILKALVVLKIYKFFCPDFLGRLVLKFMTSQAEKQIHVLPNILRSKGNERP